MSTETHSALPKTVSAAEWRTAHDQFLAKEKAATRARDALAAERRRLPMTLIAYKERMEWTAPWVSSADNTFNVDFGVTTPEGEHHGLSVFLRDGKKIYRTYFTTARGVEALGSVWTFLDLTPWGRQEQWEDSPPGTPRSPPYQWWRRHDEY